MPNDHYYKRHLPHQVPSGYPIFLTWNLKGSVSANVIDAIRAEKNRLEQSPKRPGESDYDRKLRHAKILFNQRDTELGGDCHNYLKQPFHADQHGESVNLKLLTHLGRPMWLADPAAACEVAMSIMWGVGRRYRLWAFVVMGNHCHCLLTPDVGLHEVTQGIKGFTAYKINKLHNARNRTLWQDESFDHWARDEEELYRIIDYIENNPVVSKMCESPANWPWSSAALRERFQWKRGEPFPEMKKENAMKSLKERSTSAFLG